MDPRHCLEATHRETEHEAGRNNQKGQRRPENTFIDADWRLSRRLIIDGVLQVDFRVSLIGEQRGTGEATTSLMR